MVQSGVRNRVQWSVTKVVIYRRVSTDKQERSGLGLEAQLELCNRVAESMGLEVIADYSESISGKVDPRDRPIFMTALVHAQNEGARLIVAKQDRFSREVYHVAGYTQKYMFGELTPDLIVAESPNMSQMEVYLKAMLSEQERKAISERTKAALAVRKAQGIVLGSVGRDASNQKRREATQEAINRAIELRAEGLSYKAIADTLNTEGFTTSKGGHWYAASVRDRLVPVA